jgi:hypothetical protein
MMARRMMRKHHSFFSYRREKLMYNFWGTQNELKAV